MFNYQDIIDKYYATQPELRRIYMLHCRSVADKALAIAAAQPVSSASAGRARNMRGDIYRFMLVV